jgi:hypothetical protein
MIDFVVISAIILALIYVITVVFANYARAQLGQKYAEFALLHSEAIKELNKINSEYSFSQVKVGYLREKYDNEHNYENISPKDYLTYQLIYKKKEILPEIKNAESNKRLYSVYEKRVKNISLGKFDIDKMPSDIGKIEEILKKVSIILIKKPELSREIILSKAEEKAFWALVKRPITDYYIEVIICQTQINGNVIRKKSNLFYPDEIREIIESLGHKRGDYYLDDGIWQAICRVERGRVSNKMRFAIYKRDNNRCRKCGRLGVYKDLEIDHIFPISKGGKSEFDNLQTLCHKCNSLKSNTIERGAKAPEYMTRGRNELCPMCGAPLLVRRGRYGDFLGCSNYPECRFTKQK